MAKARLGGAASDASFLAQFQLPQGLLPEPFRLLGQGASLEPGTPKASSSRADPEEGEPAPQVLALPQEAPFLRQVGQAALLQGGVVQVGEGEVQGGLLGQEAQTVEE
jgi:hypothetical protein